MNITELLETRYLSGKKATTALVRSKIDFVQWNRLLDEFPEHHASIEAYIHKLYRDRSGHTVMHVLRALAALKKNDQTSDQVKAILHFFPEILRVSSGNLLKEHVERCDMYFNSLPFDEKIRQMHETGYLSNIYASFKSTYRTWSTQEVGLVTLSYLDATAFRRCPDLSDMYQEYRKRKNEPGYEDSDWIYFLLRCFGQGHQHSALEVASIIAYSFLEEPIIPEVMYNSEHHKLWWVLLHLTSQAKDMRIIPSWLNTVSDSVNLDVLYKMPSFLAYQQQGTVMDITLRTTVSDIWHDWRGFERQFDENMQSEMSLYLNH